MNAVCGIAHQCKTRRDKGTRQRQPQREGALAADNLQRSLADAVQSQEMAGNPAVLLVTSQLRAAMAQFVRTGLEQLHVLAYQEIPDNKSITIVASIGGKS